MNEAQRNRITDYIRWGLTQEQAEGWILSGIYPDPGLMKLVRKNRYEENEPAREISMMSHVDNLRRMLEENDRVVEKKTIKVYKLVKFDDHFNKNGNFYKDQEYFSKEEAFQVQKDLIDQWHTYCNSSEENKKRANEYGPMTIKVFSFDLTEEE